MAKPGGGEVAQVHALAQNSGTFRSTLESRKFLWAGVVWTQRIALIIGAVQTLRQLAFFLLLRVFRLGGGRFLVMLASGIGGAFSRAV